MIAISNSDFEKFGCVNCGCDFVFSANEFNSSTAIIVECSECGTKFFIFADSTTSVSYSGNPDFLDYDENECTLEVTKHPRKGIPKKISTEKIVKGSSGWSIGITKEHFVSYFVKDIKTGKHIINFFDTLEKKDNKRKNCKCFLCGKNSAQFSKESNPLDIRVEIFACEEHEYLLSATQLNLILQKISKN